MRFNFLKRFLLKKYLFFLLIGFFLISFSFILPLKVEAAQFIKKIKHAPFTAKTQHNYYPTFHADYCSEDAKCDRGEGDCDSNDECISGYCAQNVGEKYGTKHWVDICEEKPLFKIGPFKISKKPKVTPTLEFKAAGYVRWDSCHNGDCSSFSEGAAVYINYKGHPIGFEHIYAGAYYGFARCSPKLGESLTFRFPVGRNGMCHINSDFLLIVHGVKRDVHAEYEIEHPELAETWRTLIGEDYRLLKGRFIDYDKWEQHMTKDAVAYTFNGSELCTGEDKWLEFTLPAEKVDTWTLENGNLSILMRVYIPKTPPDGCFGNFDLPTLDECVGDCMIDPDGPKETPGAEVVAGGTPQNYEILSDANPVMDKETFLSRLDEIDVSAIPVLPATESEIDRCTWYKSADESTLYYMYYSIPPDVPEYKEKWAEIQMDISGSNPPESINEIKFNRVEMGDKYAFPREFCEDAIGDLPVRAKEYELKASGYVRYDWCVVGGTNGASVYLTQMHLPGFGGTYYGFARCSPARGESLTFRFPVEGGPYCTFPTSDAGITHDTFKLFVHGVKRDVHAEYETPGLGESWLTLIGSCSEHMDSVLADFDLWEQHFTRDAVVYDFNGTYLCSGDLWSKWLEFTLPVDKVDEWIDANQDSDDLSIFMWTKVDIESETGNYGAYPPAHYMIDTGGPLHGATALSGGTPQNYEIVEDALPIMDKDTFLSKLATIDTAKIDDLPDTEEERERRVWYKEGDILHYYYYRHHPTIPWPYYISKEAEIQIDISKNNPPVTKDEIKVLRYSSHEEQDFEAKTLYREFCEDAIGDLPVVEHFDLNLKTGWNYMSFPLQSTDTIKNIIAPYCPGFIPWIALTYAPDTGYQNVIDKPPEQCRGYLVYTTSDCDISLTGLPAKCTAEGIISGLKTGWNLIGPGDTKIDLSGYGYTAFWYNPATKTFEETTILEPGKGYWIYEK